MASISLARKAALFVILALCIVAATIFATTEFVVLPNVALHVSNSIEFDHIGRVLRVSTFVALGVSTGVILWLSYNWMGRRIIRPIILLHDAVRTLERGTHIAVVLERQDELGELSRMFNRMARTIRERETTLRQALAELKLILDSAADTLCGCTLSGTFRGQPSAMGIEWFGEPQPDQDVASWLFYDHPTLTTQFRLGLIQVGEERLPLSVALDQLPARFERNRRSYEIVYRPIREETDLLGLLLVIQDVTAKLAASRAEREARELQIIVGNLVRDRSAFEHFIAECETLLQTLHTETDLYQRLIHLHTLKSACSIFGLLSFSEACQALETKVMVDADALNHQALRELRRSLRSTLDRVRRFAPNVDEQRVSISIADYSRFVEFVEHRPDHEELLAQAKSLPLESGERLLAPLIQQAYRLARSLGKQITVEVDDGGLRLVEESTRLFWSTLVHGLRNALEHGIETPKERLLKGKPPQGKLQFRLRDQGEHVAISLIDDGRGIDWTALARRAYMSRLPSSREDLMVLLFTDGLSTKGEISDASTRGIGLSALRASCHALGGTCIVYEGPNGCGTELVCTLSTAVACHPPTPTRLDNSHSRLSTKATEDLVAMAHWDPVAAARPR